jgi:ATP-dependent helicase Lhr and Lhr-like helicase
VLLSAIRPAPGRRRAPTRARYGRPGRPALPSRSGPPSAAGRWSRLPAREADPTRRAHAQAEVLLDRHGVLTRGAAVAERTPGGFAAVYPVLRAAEESGRARRGYFVESLGAAQFATPGAVDRLRTYATDRFPGPGVPTGAAGDGPDPAFPPAGSGRPRREPAPAVVLAATDPAQPFGAALPWPDRPSDVDGAAAAGRGHRPGRKAGALVVLVDGHLTLYVERGGRTLLSWTTDPAALQAAADALALAVREGGLGRLAVERADGESVHAPSALSDALEAAGFRPTPRGLRLRA